MKDLFLRGGIALAASIAAIGLGLCAQCVHGLSSYTGLVALWPTFLLAISVGLYLLMKRQNDPKLVPALGVLLVLPVYAAIARRPAAEEGELYVRLVASAAPMIGLAGFLAGFALDRLPRVTVGLAGATTLAALVAVAAPSLPRSYLRSHDARPETSDVAAMKLAGVLIVDGAPIRAHGVSYRMRHDAWDPSWCEVTVESNAPPLVNNPPSVIYSCRNRPLRCDDARRMCLVEDADYATGYTYDYEAIGIHGYHPPDGRLFIRIEAWILALGAVLLLYRGRTSPLRHAMAMGALASAGVGSAMMIRFFDFV